MAKLIKLIEGELEKAEITLAVKDISDTLQKMASDISRMGIDDVPPVVERIKATYGIESGNKFAETITAQLNDLVQRTLEIKSNIDDESLVMVGDASPADLEKPNDMEGPELPPDNDDLDLDDDVDSFMADVEEEPEFGRKVKESVDEDGRGSFKISYVYPDGKNIGNDRFETQVEADKFAAALKKKGYRDVTKLYPDGKVRENRQYPIIVKKLIEKCNCDKKKKIIESMYQTKPTKVMELARKVLKK